MVDLDAAIGFVVARGDLTDRARLAHLRTGSPVLEEAFAELEAGQRPDGGWPAQRAGALSSVDATCFHLSELDALGGLRRQSASRAIDWLIEAQRSDGCWEEDPRLAAVAPEWARPGDRDARFFLTASAGYWIVLSRGPAPALGAAKALATELDSAGAWPGYLVSGWLAGAVLNRTEHYYEAAQIGILLAARLDSMSVPDLAAMLAATRRAGLSTDDRLATQGRRRLERAQRSDGSWSGQDSSVGDVQTTIVALTALR